MDDFNLPRGPLSAYLGVRDANQRAGLRDTQNAAGLMGILQHAQQMKMQQQDMQDNEAIKGILSQSNGNIEAAIPQLAKIGPKGMAVAGQLAQVQQHMLAGQQAQKLADFNSTMGRFATPATPGSASPPDDQGGGPAMPAQPAGFDMRAAIKAKVRAGLLDPIAAQKELDAMSKPVSVGRGGLAIPDANSPGGYRLMTPPASPAPQSTLAKLLSERDALPPGDPKRKAYENAIAKTTTHAPAANSNVNIVQEREESKAVGKYYGERYKDIQEAAFNGQAKVNTLNRMDQLLEGVETGRLTPLGTEIAAMAASLGLKIDKNLGPKQAATALGNEIALQNRNPAGGAGMPGALSDKDREFLLQMVPGLGTTPEGRKEIISTAKQLATRDQQIAKMARDYRQKNKTIDEGFFEQVSKFADANPLFDVKETPKPARRATDTSAGKWSVVR